MGNDDLAVQALIADCCSLADEAFGKRLLAIYLIGSLAHGGFLPAVSDIGVALILDDPLVTDDGGRIDALSTYCAAAHPGYGRRLSLFWTAPAAFAATDRVQVLGRFPALDRLDLLSHGQLIRGTELREQLPAPTRRALLANCREDALRFVREQSRYGFLAGTRARAFPDRRELARLCLLPARFLYTATTGAIGSNETAAAFYQANFSGPGEQLVALGLALRQEPERVVHAAEQALLNQELPAYYRQFLGDFLLLIGGTPPEETTFLTLLAALDATEVTVD